MSRGAAALALLLALPGCQRWRRLAPEGAGFSVELPGAPSEVPSPMAQPGLPSRAWAAEGPGGARYQVAVLDLAPLPAPELEKVRAAWARELASPRSATGQGAVRVVQAGGVAWIEDELTSETLRYTGRAGLVGTRRVWLSASLPPGAEDGRARFFGSFEAR